MAELFGDARREIWMSDEDWAEAVRVEKRKMVAKLQWSKAEPSRVPAGVDANAWVLINQVARQLGLRLSDEQMASVLRAAKDTSRPGTVEGIEQVLRTRFGEKADSSVGKSLQAHADAVMAAQPKQVCKGAGLLTAFRKAAGLSQEAAAATLGVSRRAWQGWEAGEAVPQGRFFYPIANMLDLSAEQLAELAEGWRR